MHLWDFVNMFNVFGPYLLESAFRMDEHWPTNDLSICLPYCQYCVKLFFYCENHSMARNVWFFYDFIIFRAWWNFIVSANAISTFLLAIFHWWLSSIFIAVFAPLNILWLCILSFHLFYILYVYVFVAISVLSMRDIVANDSSDELYSQTHRKTYTIQKCNEPFCPKQIRQ